MLEKARLTILGLELLVAGSSFGRVGHRLPFLLFKRLLSRQIIPMSLFEQARQVRENAHAPYSGFKVGAALRSSSGKVYLGCNVENAAYPEGTCAEAGAIAAMVAAGETELAEICIVAELPSRFPVMPADRRVRAARCTRALSKPDGETVRRTGRPSSRLLHLLPRISNGRSRHLGKVRDGQPLEGRKSFFSHEA